MTRQPSTRTAEPRTAAGRALYEQLAKLGMAHAMNGFVGEGILAIEAEAAAPAGLDVDVLNRAILDELAVRSAHPLYYGREPSEWTARPDVVSTQVRSEVAQGIADRYARLRQGTEGS